MKKTILFFAIALFSATLFAENNDFDKRLLVKYSKEELATMKKDNAEQFKYVNHCLSKAWYLAPLPKEKMKSKENPFFY